jgi:phage shock protein A
MNFFKRLTTLFRAWANALVGRMEDPSKMLTTALGDMNEQLSEAAGQVGRVVAEQRRLDKQVSAHKEQAAAWEKKAMIAVGQGRDNLARACLDNKQAAERQAALLTPALEQQTVLAAQMRAEVQRMKARIDEARAKKTLLEARQKSAEAQSAVLTSLEALDASDANSAIGKLEAAVMSAESAADATAELSVDVDLERQLAALTAEPIVDDALAALRAKMGMELAAPLVADAIAVDEQVEAGAQAIDLEQLMQQTQEEEVSIGRLATA